MPITSAKCIVLAICLLAGLSDAGEQEPRQLPQSPTSPYLPLTTVFTPPSACFTDVSLLEGYGYPASYSVGLGPGNKFSECSPCWLGLASTSTCFPSGWNTAAVFSPGACPRGYSIGCSSINRIGTLSETVATCCPSGYVCAPESRIAAFPWYSAQPCSYYPNYDFSISALSIGVGTTITTEFPATIATGFAILANSVQVRWQSSDFLPASSTSTTLSSSQSSSTPTSSSSSSAESTAEAAGGSKGLSSGAKAGVGVAVAAVSLGVIIGAGLCLRRRRNTTNQSLHAATSTGEVTGHDQYVKPELDATTVWHPVVRNDRNELGVGTPELETSPISELSAR